MSLACDYHVVRRQRFITLLLYEKIITEQLFPFHSIARSKSMANTQTASALDVLWRQAPGGDLLELGRVYRGPLALSRLHTTPRRILSRREAALLGAFALVLHGAVIY
jgi:hypothetical protein